MKRILAAVAVAFGLAWAAYAATGDHIYGIPADTEHANPQYPTEQRTSGCIATNSAGSVFSANCTSDGYVGVNNSAPEYPLDVTGTARATNVLVGAASADANKKFQVVGGTAAFNDGYLLINRDDRSNWSPNGQPRIMWVSTLAATPEFSYQLSIGQFGPEFKTQNTQFEFVVGNGIGSPGPYGSSLGVRSMDGGRGGNVDLRNNADTQGFEVGWHSAWPGITTTQGPFIINSASNTVWIGHQNSPSGLTYGQLDTPTMEADTLQLGINQDNNVTTKPQITAKWDISGGSGTFKILHRPGGDSGSFQTVATFQGGTGRLGLGGLTAPDYTLHTSGDEYASGQKIVGGTLTVAGAAFSIGGSTLTVATTGIVTAPSQPSVLVARNVSAQSIPTGQLTDVYWQTAQHNRNGMFNAASSSNTLTARGAGIYLIRCSITFAANTTGVTRTVRLITGSTYSDANKTEQGNNAMTVENQVIWSLADGAGVKCRVNQDSGGGLNIGTTDTDKYDTSFSMTKLW